MIEWSFTYLFSGLGFNDEPSLEDSMSTVNSVFGGIVFLDSTYEGTELPKTIAYKIRLHAEQYNGFYVAGSLGLSSSSLGWLTDKNYPDFSLVGPRQNDSYGGKEPGENNWIYWFSYQLMVTTLLLCMAIAGYSVLNEYISVSYVYVCWDCLYMIAYPAQQILNK